MSRTLCHNLLAAAALALSAGLCAALVAGVFVDVSAWPIRGLMLLVGTLLGGGATLLLLRGRQHECRNASRHFEALCELASQSGYASPDDEPLPPAPEGAWWRGIAEELDEAVLRLRRRVQELEKTRTALEVRCHRATEKAEQARHIVSGLADPILAIDDYDEVILMNHSAEALFGVEPEKAESRALAKLVRCENLVQLLTGTRQRKTSVRRTDELEITDLEGHTHCYRATAVKLGATEDGDRPDETGAGAVVVLRDIGDQKALQKRNAEFVSSVSHEMKTPLAGIKAYVELLADGDAEDEQTREEFLGIINGQTDRLQRLVDNLLNLARIEAGVANVSKQQRPLNELLEEALHVVQPSAEAKNIELRSELSPLHLGVLADRDMMLQAAINLLSNAIKYTHSGGKVKLRSRLVDDQVRFEVQDSGVGLSEDDCRRVFEKFYRVKKDKDMASGTGLGLPLAKHIVEEVHGGKLTVASILGQGSSFIVTLPCTSGNRD